MRLSFEHQEELDKLPAPFRAMMNTVLPSITLICDDFNKRKLHNFAAFSVGAWIVLRAIEDIPEEIEGGKELSEKIDAVAEKILRLWYESEQMQN